MENLRIEIRKKERKLLLVDDDRLVRTFEVVFGSAPVGSKEIEGDGKTPEGEFYVCVKNPESKFHLSLGLSYPNVADAERGLESGLISRDEHDAIVEAIKTGQMPLQSTALGGEIYIHGGGTDGDWTGGCIGVTDNEMNDLYDTTHVGTRVIILP
jgi:murein L,D-transpeptidase YafK